MRLLSLFTFVACQPAKVAVSELPIDQPSSEPSATIPDNPDDTAVQPSDEPSEPDQNAADADGDGEVVRRARGRAERLDLLLEVGDGLLHRVLAISLSLSLSSLTRRSLIALL